MTSKGPGKDAKHHSPIGRRRHRQRHARGSSPPGRQGQPVRQRCQGLCRPDRLAEGLRGGPGCVRAHRRLSPHLRALPGRGRSAAGQGQSPPGPPLRRSARPACQNGCRRRGDARPLRGPARAAGAARPQRDPRCHEGAAGRPPRADPSHQPKQQVGPGEVRARAPAAAERVPVGSVGGAYHRSGNGSGARRITAVGLPDTTRRCRGRRTTPSRCVPEQGRSSRTGAAQVSRWACRSYT